MKRPSPEANSEPASFRTGPEPNSPQTTFSAKELFARHRPHLSWVATGAGLAFACVFGLHHAGFRLHQEQGVIERLSLLFWAFSGLVAAWGAARATHREARLLDVWLGSLAALAALREMDAHILMNPRYLGDLGVRFRLDWWTDGSVSVWLKLGWTVLFLGVGLVTVYPPMKLRRWLWLQARQGNPAIGLLVAAVGFLAMGFVIDDLLRPIRFINLDIKQLVEETSETIGAALYAVATVLLIRRPRMN
ncbi:MAG: hypothetical protein ACYDC1_24870 [Limisphaerales bacterium]